MPETTLCVEKRCDKSGKAAKSTEQAVMSPAKGNKHENHEKKCEKGMGQEEDRDRRKSQQEKSMKSARIERKQKRI